MVKVISNITQYKEELSKFKNKSIGYVPTMGALHEGHATLLKKSISENDITICSVFVNPTQFNNPEDLKKYPRTLEADLDILKNIGVDYLFYPEFKDMYPDNYQFKIEENTFSKILCGKYRPGHFDGVLTVVMKLFNIIKPHRAYFGEKDFQQLKLIQDMVKAFFMDIEVVAIPTVRDAKGLALSSRNTHLSKEGLLKAQTFAFLLKKHLSIEDLKTQLNKESIEVEYLEDHQLNPSRRFAAVWIDGVRLIDNV